MDIINFLLGNKSLLLFFAILAVMGIFIDAILNKSEKEKIAVCCQKSFIFFQNIETKFLLREEAHIWQKGVLFVFGNSAFSRKRFINVLLFYIALIIICYFLLEIGKFLAGYKFSFPFSSEHWETGFPLGYTSIYLAVAYTVVTSKIVVYFFDMKKFSKDLLGIFLSCVFFIFSYYVMIAAGDVGIFLEESIIALYHITKEWLTHIFIGLNEDALKLLNWRISTLREFISRGVERFSGLLVGNSRFQIWTDTEFGPVLRSQSIKFTQISNTIKEILAIPFDVVFDYRSAIVITHRSHYRGVELKYYIIIISLIGWFRIFFLFWFAIMYVMLRNFSKFSRKILGRLLENGKTDKLFQLIATCLFLIYRLIDLFFYS